MKKLIGGFAFILLLIGCATTNDVPTSNQSDETIPATYNQPNSSQVEQVPYGGFCCDAYGFRRCVLDYPAPVFANCWCRGQGNGYVCM